MFVRYVFAWVLWLAGMAACVTFIALGFEDGWRHWLYPLTGVFPLAIASALLHRWSVRCTPAVLFTVYLFAATTFWCVSYSGILWLFDVWAELPQYVDTVDGRVLASQEETMAHVLAQWRHSCAVLTSWLVVGVIALVRRWGWNGRAATPNEFSEVVKGTEYVGPTAAHP
jgi:hypothetical protein